MNLFSNGNFWLLLDKLVNECPIVIDRPQGSCHPLYTNLIYPFDYGYLNNTKSTDGDGIDIWIGSSPTKEVVAFIITIDNVKKDMEMKLIISCTHSEIMEIFNFHNSTSEMQGILIEKE